MVRAAPRVPASTLAGPGLCDEKTVNGLVPAPEGVGMPGLGQLDTQGSDMVRNT